MKLDFQLLSNVETLLSIMKHSLIKIYNFYALSWSLHKVVILVVLFLRKTRRQKSFIRSRFGELLLVLCMDQPIYMKEIYFIGMLNQKISLFIMEIIKQVILMYPSQHSKTYNKSKLKQELPTTQVHKFGKIVLTTTNAMFGRWDAQHIRWQH